MTFISNQSERIVVTLYRTAAKYKEVKMGMIGTKVALLVAFATTMLSMPSVEITAFSLSPTLCSRKTSFTLFSTAPQQVHPAVEGWPEKYTGTGGPRVLHQGFFVEKATDQILEELDVANWPTWTTSDKPKWTVGNQNVDKVMPYSELSYVIKGKLEIIPPSGDKVIIREGDLVTFPEGFCSSWRVLEELTWHYYLY